MDAEQLKADEMHRVEEGFEKFNNTEKQVGEIPEPPPYTGLTAL